MLALALLSCLALDPSGASLGPGEDRSVDIMDADGTLIATVDVRTDEATSVALPPGRYTAQGSLPGDTSTPFTVNEGETTGVALPGETPAADPQASSSSRASSSAPEESVGGASSSARLPTSAPQTAITRPQPAWHRWGAPLLSAVLPGLGQAINGEPGKAAGAFGGTVGLLAGAALLRPADGAGARGVLNPGVLPREDAAALAGFGVLVHAAAALYIAQILDAHAVGRGRPVEAHRDARVRVQLGRSTTLAMAPGEENIALYADTSVAVMARVSRRVSVGVGDLGFKVAGGSNRQAAGRTTGFHGGVRSMVRLLDTRPRWMSRAGAPSRLWLLAGGGATVQASIRLKEQSALQPGSSGRQTSDDQTSVTLYALGEAHYFLLDRWSLAMAPRLSVPLATRHYTGGRALPRYAPSFELGLSLGVWL